MMFADVCEQLGIVVERDLQDGDALVYSGERGTFVLRGPAMASGGAGAGPPTGTIVAFGGEDAPEGWLLCDGGEVSRGTYADLFGVISDTFGAGDGSTTFNVPDLRIRFPVGAGPGTNLAEDEGEADPANRDLSHAHTVNGTTDAASGGSGAVEAGVADTVVNLPAHVHDFSSVPTTNETAVPYLAVNFIIKT